MEDIGLSPLVLCLGGPRVISDLDVADAGDAEDLVGIGLNVVGPEVGVIAHKGEGLQSVLLDFAAAAGGLAVEDDAFLLLDGFGEGDNVLGGLVLTGRNALGLNLAAECL